MTQQRTYATWVRPRGLARLWWTLQRRTWAVFHHLRALYRRRYPPPEKSHDIGLTAKVVQENRLKPPVGSVGTVARSEVRDGARVYLIEFEDMTLITGLPAPRILELVPPR